METRLTVLCDVVEEAQRLHNSWSLQPRAGEPKHVKRGKLPLLHSRSEIR